MEENKSGKRIGILSGLLFVVCVIIVGIIVSSIEKTNTRSKEVDERFDKIKISYSFGSIVNFSGTYEEEQMFEVDLQGDQLKKLQNLLQQQNIDSDQYKMEEIGHYHESTFYGGYVMIPGEYRLQFNDGSEMIVDEMDYEMQYKKGENYYLITDGEDIAKTIIKIVDTEIHKEVTEMETEKISIQGLSSGKTLTITDSELITKILGEYIYKESNVVDEELYNTLIEYEQEDYTYGRKRTRELEYQIDFNNGTIIKIGLRNGNIGCISDKNGTFVQGIQINPKFVFLIHNLFTDYYKKTDKLFNAEIVYVKHNGLEIELSDSDKEKLFNKLVMIELDQDINEIELEESDYIIRINNNRIILKEDELYIIYPDGDCCQFYSVYIPDFIKGLGV